MAQTNYTPIQLYYSSTASAVPVNTNLASGELAINITDGLLFYKDNAGTVQKIGYKLTPTTAGGTGLTSFTANGIVYASSTSALNTSSALTFDGTKLQVSGSDIRIVQASNSANNGLYFRNFADSATFAKVAYEAATGYLQVGTTQAYDTIFLQNNAEAMRLTSTGLGIGTSSPAYKLDVNGTSRMSSGLLIQGSSLTATASQVTIDQLNTTTSRIISWGPNASTAGILYFGNLSSNASVGSASNMVLDSSGTLCIGTTSALSSSFKTNIENGRLGVSANSDQYALYLRYNTSTNGAYIGSPSANALAFSGSGGGEYGRFDSSGNLLVGTTSTSTTSNVGLKFIYDASFPYISTVGTATTNSNVAYTLYSTGAAAYRFYVGYGGTVYATSTTITAISDQRLKENIRDLDDGLASVMALKPRKFDWKEGKGANIKDARGFIAQEFETVFPDMIDEWRDPAPEGEEPYKAINANLIPTLVKAIQEQQAIIQSLTARITALEGA